MATKYLGDGDCHLCGAGVRVGEMVNGRSCYSCPECSNQVFARGGRSDLIIRDMIKSDKKEIPAAVIEVAKKHKKKSKGGFFSAD